MKCIEETSGYCETKIKYNKYIKNELCEECCMFCSEQMKRECDTACYKALKQQGQEEKEKAKVVYIAGKITGDDNYKEKFNAAEEHLKKSGYIVLNPAWLPNAGLEYEQYMRIGSKMLDEADAIYLIKDYKDSPGAIRELRQAVIQNKEILR